MIIYHARGTRSVRPIWLCFELDLDPGIETVEFSPEFLASKEWRSISPAGKLPVLKDGTLTLFESGAMMEYILDKYGQGRLRPQPGTNDYALHQQWFWFGEATLSRPLGMNKLLSARDQQGTAIADEAIQKIETCLTVIDQQLKGQEYLLDEFYAADIMMGYTLELTRRFKILNDRFPNALRYLDALIARDACQRVLKL